jgi:hypothetical protein
MNPTPSPSGLAAILGELRELRTENAALRYRIELICKKLGVPSPLKEKKPKTEQV